MRAITLSLAFLIGVSSVAHDVLAGDTTSTLRRASSYFQRGGKALEKGDARQATALFQKALGVLPNFPEAHLGLGHIAMQEGRFRDALVEYEAAREGFTAVSQLMHEHEMEKFRNAQRQILELEDQIRTINDPTINVSPATRKMKTLQLEQAIQTLRAIDFPDTADAHRPPAEYHFHVGNALFRLDRTDEAIASWRVCVDRDPGFALPYNNLAVAYLNQGRLIEARDSLEQARRLGLTINPALEADLRDRMRTAGIGGGASGRDTR